MTTTFSVRRNGVGLPLVLIHAFPTDSRLFDGLIGDLPAQLITPDLPGFGRTPLPEPAPDVLTVEGLVDDLEAWLDAEALGAVVLGGVAIGGYLALELVTRRPDLAGAVVLMGCKPAPDAPAMSESREGVARLALTEGSEAVAAALTDLPLAPDASPEVRAVLRTMIADADPRGIAGLVRGLHRRPDPVPAIRSIRVPTLVVCGAADPFTPPATAGEMATMVPGARYVEIPDAGHLVPLEAPAACASALTDFLATLSR